MKHGGNRSHDPSEDLRSRGETKTQSLELVRDTERHKMKKLARIGMYRDLKVDVLQIDKDHPGVPPYRKEDLLVGLHLEPSLDDETVQAQKVDDRLPRAGGLPDHEETAVVARRQRGKFDHPLLQERKNFLLKGLPLDGRRGIAGHGWRESGGGEEKGMQYLVLNTSTTQGFAPSSLQDVQWRDRQPPTCRGEGHGSYLQKFFLGVEHIIPPKRDLQLPSWR